MTEYKTLIRKSDKQYVAVYTAGRVDTVPLPLEMTDSAFDSIKKIYSFIDWNLYELITVAVIQKDDEAERFIKPTDKQLIEIAILFNNGKLQKKKLTDMISMSEFVIDRLHENGDVSKPSKKENP